MRSFGVFTVVLLMAVASRGEQKSRPDLNKALVLQSQGSFFVGGESRTIHAPAGREPATGEITVNQMYVQYQIPPKGDQHLPVVMVHGCCLSAKTWETTPDGRMGWNEYFVRHDRSVYLADQVSRGRSGFDPTVINAVKSGSASPSELPNVIAATHEVAWSVFRFGPAFNKPFPDGQFPVEAVDELYKQMIPDLNALLPTPNPTWKNMAALAVRLHGAVLMGHSESGFFPEQAALLDPTGISGMISIEMPCPVLPPSDIALIAKIPTLVMFGDHLDDMPAGIANWASSFAGCQKFVQQVKDAGGDAEMMHLPKLGIKGNSHMLMQDRNNLQLADLLLARIDKHVQTHKKSSR